MTLYLVRHDDVGKTGICYGQTDFAPLRPYPETAQAIKPLLPEQPSQVISSPLIRCQGLARALYPSLPITLEPAFQEIHFGDWENTPWQSIERSLIDDWAKTPLAFTFPNGESTDAFAQRVRQAARALANIQADTVLVTHAGVIRLLLALAKHTAWFDELNTPIPYASVWPIKL